MSITIGNKLIGYFFSSNAHHRDLPSFPTRRSSDLPRGRGTEVSRRGTRPVAPLGAYGHSGRSARPAPRSEEHTSELQSRENLVCRLLLEKKKNMRRTFRTPRAKTSSICRGPHARSR